MNKYFGLQGRLVGIMMLLLSAYVSLTESSKSDFDGSEDRTTFACDGSPLLLSCSEGVIQITRANYGRFSIAICNEEGRTDWSVNCFTPRSSAVLSQACNNLQKCQVNASDFVFGSNPCPETRRYLEAHYNCVPASDKAMPPWMTSSKNNNSKKGQKASRRVPITAAPTTTSTTTTTTTTTSTTTTTTSVARSTLRQSSDHPSEDDDEISSSTFRSVSAAPIFYVESSSSSADGLESLSFCHKRNTRGLSWPQTPSGSEAALRCPNDALSLARWSCESGTWVGAWPDLSDCTSPWLRALEVGGVSDIGALTGELIGRVRSSPLYGGDVRGLLRIVRGLVGRKMGSWRTRDLIASLSALLDKRALPAWKDLSESLRESNLKELMAVTEDLGGGFGRKDLSLSSDNIDIIVKGGHDGGLTQQEGGDYLTFNTSVGVRPRDLLMGKPSRSLVLATFRRISFLLHPHMSSEVKSVGLYEEGNRVNYEGGFVRASFSHSVGGACGVWNHESWDTRLCSNEEGDCLCGVYGRMAVFTSSEGSKKGYANAPGVVRGPTEEEEDGVSQVTFIIVVVVTSIISVASLLSFTLIIIYCRRVKIQDKWDRSWYCRKRETDLSDTHTSSTSVPNAINSGSRLLHHQMTLTGSEPYSHPLFGGGEQVHGSSLNNHHLGPNGGTGAANTSSNKTHKGGYQELCINPPQYGSQTLLGNNSGGPGVHKSDWSSLAPRRSDYPGKRIPEDLVYGGGGLPPNRIRPSRSCYQHHNSSTSSSSAGGTQQHIYMEVDHRYDGDSGFTEESSYDARRLHHVPLPSNRIHSHELICDGEEEEVLSSPRESRTSSHSEGELDEDFDAPLRSLGHTRRRTQPRNTQAYLLSWQMNNKAPREKVYKDGEGTQDERDVFTITGFNR